MLAKIKFREYDDKYYYIVGFENIIVKDALPAAYLADCPYFYASTWDRLPSITLVTEHELYPKGNYPESGTRNGNKKHRFVIVQDSCIYKDDLSKLIAVMKRAGKRLTDIKQKKKEFTITI